MVIQNNKHTLFKFMGLIYAEVHHVLQYCKSDNS